MLVLYGIYVIYKPVFLYSKKIRSVLFLRDYLKYLQGNIKEYFTH